MVRKKWCACEGVHWLLQFPIIKAIAIGMKDCWDIPVMLLHLSNDLPIKLFLITLIDIAQKWSELRDPTFVEHLSIPPRILWRWPDAY